MHAPGPAGGAISFAEVLDTLLLRAGFNTSVVIIGTTLLGLTAGVVGVFMLLRKRSLMTDALSHATLPGVALAFLIVGSSAGLGRSLPLLLAGATISGVAGVLVVQALVRFTRLREDAAIGIVLSVFFGAGVVLLSYIQQNAPSGSAGLARFIYGQTAAMAASDAVLMASIAMACVLVTGLCVKEFALVCFDDAFARVGGWPVTWIDLAMLAMVVVVTVAGLQAVGLILVVAMLIIPPVAARFWTERLGVLIVVSGGIGAASGYVGSAVSALLPRRPAGAVIVLVAGAMFAISMLIAPSRGVIAAAIRRARLRLKIASEHMLEACAQAGTDAPILPRCAAVARHRGWPPWLRPAVFLLLRARGELTGRGSATRLTRAGVARGARVARNHALWAQYLVSHADLAPGHVDWSVDQVEHVLSDALIRELETAIAARRVAEGTPTTGALP